MKTTMIVAAFLLAASVCGLGNAAKPFSHASAKASVTAASVTESSATETETNAYGKHPGECGYGYIG